MEELSRRWHRSFIIREPWTGLQGKNLFIMNFSLKKISDKKINVPRAFLTGKKNPKRSEDPPTAAGRSKVNDDDCTKFPAAADGCCWRSSCCESSIDSATLKQSLGFKVWDYPSAATWTSTWTLWHAKIVTEIFKFEKQTNQFWPFVSKLNLIQIKLIDFRSTSA